MFPAAAIAAGLAAAVLSLVPGPLFAQDGIVFDAVPPGERWTVTTRWDYRIRIDGRYKGHADREFREVYFRSEEVPGGWRINGEVRVLGNAKKDGLPIAARLDDRENIDFVLTDNGSVIEADNGYPWLRGFPTFPDKELEEGDEWEAPLDILVIGPEGEKAVLPQTASYRFMGRGSHMGKDAYFIEAQWAVRYRGGNPEINEFLEELEGSHRVNLILDARTRSPVMARDLLSETWHWADSRVEEREGFALIFWDGVPPLETDLIVKEIEDHFPGDESDENIVIERTARGLSVTLRNLHFQPDTAVIVSEDSVLLDELAGILEAIPERTVMVRGHTADVGRPGEQYSLSEKRAKHVADELNRRGVDPRRLIYEGVGADEPVGDNGTEEGRIRNRRVELFILED